MRRIPLIALLACLPLLVFGQHKAQSQMPDMRTAITGSTHLLGWFNPAKFSMNHSFSTSFIAGGGGGMMLNTYMNTMNYQFNDQLTLKLNLGLMNSPYNSFNKTPAFNSLDQTRFFGGGELQYKPSDNMRVSLGIQSYPGAGYYYYSPYWLGDK